MNFLLISITSINQREALRYLRYGSNVPDDNIQSVIDRCEKELLAVINPRYTYKVFDISDNNNNIHLNGCKLILKGNDITNHLNGCIKAVLMCATLSADTDKLIRNTQINNMTEAVILDSLASVCTEQLCDEVEKEIHDKFPQYFHTWRYSAGYGDFPIDIQSDFISILDAQKRIGLCVTSSGMLTPKKSVTAVIGLSENPVNLKKRGCLTCSMQKTCQFRRKGERCEF